MHKILYIQFTDPGCYPPIFNSSRILAERGWKVLMLGMHFYGGKKFDVHEHENIRIKRMWYSPQLIIQKIQYGLYLVWAVIWTLRFRPSWIYASDHFSAPVALIVRALFDVKIVYHEHDSILDTVGHSWMMNFCLNARNRLAKKAQIIIIPNKERIIAFKERLGPRVEPMCVWNCSSSKELSTTQRLTRKNEFRLIYCGSVNDSRLPMTVLEAMQRVDGIVTLSIIGYETIGNQGYLNRSQEYAQKLGLNENWFYLGAIQKRADMLAELGNHDLGLSFMPRVSADVNMRYMHGASNKPFDYLSQGVAVMVNDAPDWMVMFEQPGYGISCNLESVEQLTKTLNYCLKNRDQIKLMGQRGRERMANDWNYETQFQPVLEKFEE